MLSRMMLHFEQLRQKFMVVTEIKWILIDQLAKYFESVKKRKNEFNEIVAI